MKVRFPERLKEITVVMTGVVIAFGLLTFVLLNLHVNPSPVAQAADVTTAPPQFLPGTTSTSTETATATSFVQLPGRTVTPKPKVIGGFATQFLTQRVTSTPHPIFVTRPGVTNTASFFATATRTTLVVGPTSTTTVISTVVGPTTTATETLPAVHTTTTATATVTGPTVIVAGPTVTATVTPAPVTTTTTVTPAPVTVTVTVTVPPVVPVP